MIGLAEEGLERQLDRLWRASFNDPMKVSRYFMKYKYLPQNCVVYTEGEEVVSALHLLPAKIQLEGKLYPAQYVYAAATLPEFRNKGCMSQLLDFAAELGRQRGIACSVLVPSTQSLFKFYEKFGYHPFFYVRSVKVERGKLRTMAIGGKVDVAAISNKLMASVRASAFTEQDGHIIWGKEAVSFAEDFQYICGGDVFSAAKDGSVGYAFFRKGESMGEITEIVADENTFPALAYQMVTTEKCGMFQFRLPVKSRLFAGEGEVLPFGMLCRLRDDIPTLPIEERSPYIGLELN